MAKIIPFPETRKHASSLVDDIIDLRMGHKHPAVLDCLKKEMKNLVLKYFNNEEISASLILPADLTEDQFQMIEQSFKKTFQEHNNRMVNRANDLFLDLCLSRMTICELRHQIEDEN